MVGLQLTKCVGPGDDGDPILEATLIGLGFGSVWGFAVWLIGLGAIPSIVGGLSAATYGAFVGYCNYFFNRRLVCIAKSDVLIGRVISQHEAAEDGDWTLNVLAAPFKLGDTMAKMISQNAVQRRFFINHYPNHYSNFAGYAQLKNGTPLIHTEIEGTKMKAWCDISKAVSAGSAVAAPPAIAAACTLGPVACAVTALAFLFAILITAFTSRGAGKKGAVKNVIKDPNSTTVNTTTPKAIKNLDPVAIQGRFIFDPVHRGYNEIHAVRKIISITDDDHNKLDKKRAKEIEKLIDQAEDPSTKQIQMKEIHVVDPRVG